MTASHSIGFLASIRLRVIRSMNFQVATCAKLKLLNGSLMKNLKLKVDGKTMRLPQQLPKVRFNGIKFAKKLRMH